VRLRGAAAALCLALSTSASAVLADASTPVTPEEHRRGTEQTFLTFPEWFLVHSPAEYATFVSGHPPSEFPFFGHVGQFWSSYAAVYRATKYDYPFNFGYHVMIMVIGTSTTVEYALRSAYETLVGRVTELTQTHGMTEEDKFGARVAQDYVDFIRVQPWYEYDFKDKLVKLWTQTGLWGPDMLRKWERKYALTTEYGAKAFYGWIIKLGTKASYDAPLPVTAVLLDRLPEGVEAGLPELKVLRRLPDGTVLITVPRYEAFKQYSAALARAGAGFREIAGNRSVILVSLLVPAAWQPDPEGPNVLFTQPIITQPGRKRVALVVPVSLLAVTLKAVPEDSDQLEHVYDY